MNRAKLGYRKLNLQLRQFYLLSKYNKEEQNNSVRVEEQKQVLFNLLNPFELFSKKQKEVTKERYVNKYLNSLLRSASNDTVYNVKLNALKQAGN
ncbi:MAG: hypothetical protein FWF42_04060 [Streptococcaceae bacterium]|nr:hypothetical protein [Streptococcaceae bacterium]